MKSDHNNAKLPLCRVSRAICMTVLAKRKIQRGQARPRGNLTQQAQLSRPQRRARSQPKTNASVDASAEDARGNDDQRPRVFALLPRSVAATHLGCLTALVVHWSSLNPHAESSGALRQEERQLIPADERQLHKLDAELLRHALAKNSQQHHFRPAPR